jgi:hypothetical protein
MHGYARRLPSIRFPSTDGGDQAGGPGISCRLMVFATVGIRSRLAGAARAACLIRAPAAFR